MRKKQDCNKLDYDTAKKLLAVIVIRL